MRIDPLMPLVPHGYKVRQKVLDAMFAIGKKNPQGTCHLDELTQRLGKGEIELVILYMVRNKYAKWVGNDGDPLYSLTPKGQTASMDREFHRTGRNERYKTLQVYSGILGIAGSVIGMSSILYTHLTKADITARIESMEEIMEHIGAESELETTGQFEQPFHHPKVALNDTVSSVK